MRFRLALVLLLASCLVVSVVSLPAQQQVEPLFRDRINVEVPHISTDPTIRYDYDIVYVRAPRRGDDQGRFYTDFSAPVTMEPGADLMLLHPDGREELLVAGKNGSITDPVVSFDGQWVYYVHLHDLRDANQGPSPAAGADIYKIHLASRRIVRLTDQTFTPNTGAADWARNYRTPSNDRTYYAYGVYNTGPFPLPGGKLVFTSNRDGFRPARGYPPVALQLFVMDDSDTGLGTNLEKIGHFNLAGALHPVTLADGRIMFSSLESQGIRSDILWGIWTIHPDGTNWAPLVSAFDTIPAPSGFHFQTQLSDGAIVVEEYYNQNNSGFGALIKLPPSPPAGYPAFGPAYMRDPRNRAWRYGRYDNGKGKWYTKPFMPTGAVSLTPFAHGLEGPADPSVLGDKNSPRVGKFTHPSGAPDNHLLVVYSPGPVNHQYRFLPQVDGGIYLAKNGDVIGEPADLRLIKNDPRYNESWPRAVVPYRRIYGVDEPIRLAPLRNDGSLSPHLPEGTPFGLVGSSSMYKRESYPNGIVRQGSVTAGYAGGDDPWKGLDPFTSRGRGMPLNLHNQGGDVGVFENRDIHAIRVLAMEPTTDRHRGKDVGSRFFSLVRERLRILGEVPLRKFDAPAGGSPRTVDGQPLDPDGNPDTSFLARIPADTAFTFQLLDQRGMVLVHSQTWHQLRPGEIRTNCGGCHAHSQAPTDFAATAAGRSDYPVWDLVNRPPLLTTKAGDQSRRRWNIKDSGGVRFAERDSNRRFADVEYLRDVRPILRRSCVPCHSRQKGYVAAELDLDADGERVQVDNHGDFPGTYYRLAIDERARFGIKPLGWDSWGYPNVSRYVRRLQARRSLLIWKIFGERLDGFTNDNFPSEKEPGSGQLVHKGQPVDLERHKANQDLDYVGEPMPPPDAVAGRYVGPDGRIVKVEPLTDEDRLTIVRWIDLGCPIDLDGVDPLDRKARRGLGNLGWHLDDTRPTLTLAEPRAESTDPIRRILIGMHDYHSGIDMTKFVVKTDFPMPGLSAGKNLAGLFREKSQGVWELMIEPPVASALQGGGRIEVSVADRQGNVTKIERRLTPRR